MKRPDYGNATPEDVARAMLRSKNVRLRKEVVRDERQDAPDQTRDDESLIKGKEAGTAI